MDARPMIRRISCTTAAVLLLASVALGEDTFRIPLDGAWRFALDPQDRGVRECWWRSALPAGITLPGALQNQGHGDPVTVTTPWVSTLHDPHWWKREEYKAGASADVRTPFHLQPRRHYTGAAWYQRTVVVPASWASRRTVLTLERPHWKTDVWLDERHVGSSDSLGTPHVFDLGVVASGHHQLTVRVDNRMVVPVGENAHSVTDATQGAWNGIVGEIALTSTSLVFLEDVEVHPRVAARSARVVVRLGNASGRPGSGRLKVGTQEVPVSWHPKGGDAEVEVFLGAEAPLWDEFAPVLHRLTVRVTGRDADDSREVSFGLREIGVRGTQFTLNGRPIYLRGTHDGCVFPLTGYPATDLASWRRIIRVAQAHGLNHMRFHSWCPPKAAFVAADELGFYLQPECSVWARDGVRIDPGNRTEEWIRQETLRMVKAYGNHPSFLFLSHGNEPQGRWTESLSRWVEHWRRRDPRRLYAAATGVPMRHELGPVTGTDYLVLTRIGDLRVRGEGGWDGKDYRLPVEGTDVPIVSHELGQYAAYPDLDAGVRYTGALAPRYLEVFRESLAKNGLLWQLKDFIAASGRLQALAYKEEIEACLRTPGHAGFQLLDLRDYPGQGVSPIGVVDVFWESKGAITPEEYRRFCNTTVPLARLAARTLTQGDTLQAEIEVAHFGQTPVDVVPRWRVTTPDGTSVAKGSLPRRTMEIGNAQRLGTISLDTSTLAAPAAYRLLVDLGGFENDWTFWVYPAQPVSSRILVTRSLDEAIPVLAGGGKVLFCPRPEDIGWDSPPFTFAPIFWNRQLFPRWDRSLGLLADPDHPALRLFPSEGHSDWQWEGLIRLGARALTVTRLPVVPIVQAIDDWTRNEKQALVFEARTGGGSLLVSAFDLTKPAAPPVRQLLRSLTAYMESPEFRPTALVSIDEVRLLLFETRIMARLGARAEGSGALALDGNPETFWSERGGEGPHRLTVALGREVSADGVLVLFPQKDRKRLGEIADFTLETSLDGFRWDEVARGHLASTYRTQRIAFPSSTRLRHVRLTALSSHDGGPAAVLAELALLGVATAPLAAVPTQPEPGAPKAEEELEMVAPES